MKAKSKQFHISLTLVCLHMIRFVVISVVRSGALSPGEPQSAMIKRLIISASPRPVMRV